VGENGFLGGGQGVVGEVEGGEATGNFVRPGEGDGMALLFLAAG